MQHSLYKHWYLKATHKTSDGLRKITAGRRGSVLVVLLVDTSRMDSLCFTVYWKQAAGSVMSVHVRFLHTAPLGDVYIGSGSENDGCLVAELPMSS